MQVKFKELGHGQTFCQPTDQLCQGQAFFKLEFPEASSGMMCDHCGASRFVIWNARNLESGETAHFCPDEVVNILPVLRTYNTSKKRKWRNVIGFRLLPHDSPATAMPDIEFARFTGLGDAFTYLYDLAKRPVIKECYHMIVIR